MSSKNPKPNKINIISKKTYEKIDKSWDLLSENAQLIILNIFNDADKYQNLAIKKAYENDPNFKHKIKTKIDNEKKNVMQEIENSDYENNENIDELLHNI